MNIFGGNAAVAVALMALGLAAGAGPARASSVTALEGSWTVAQASVIGGLADIGGRLAFPTGTAEGSLRDPQSLSGWK